MNVETRVCQQGLADVQLRVDGDRNILTGYGAVFYRSDDPGTEFELWPGVYERIMPTAFDRALEEQDDVRGLFNHDPDNLLGRTSAGTMELRKNRRGLQYEIPLDTDDPDHMRVARKIKRGDLTGSSFAFVVDDEGFRMEDGREIREVRSVTLVDTGPVTFPAYTSSSTTLRDMAVAEKRFQQWRDDRTQRIEKEMEDYRRRATVASLDI